MKIIVGLGNPGARYTHTRHNIGVRVVESFGAECGITLSDRRFQGRFGIGQFVGAGAKPQEIALLLPETFMNRSGEAVAEVLAELPVGDVAPDLLVVFDDLDLPFGKLRIRPGGSSAGHRGLASVIECMGDCDVPRLRFGIGRPGSGMDTIEWVLQAFSEAENAALKDHVPRAVEAIKAILIDGVESAMNRWNRKPSEAALPESSS